MIKDKRLKIFSINIYDYYGMEAIKYCDLFPLEAIQNLFQMMSKRRVFIKFREWFFKLIWC